MRLLGKGLLNQPKCSTINAGDLCLNESIEESNKLLLFAGVHDFPPKDTNIVPKQ
jgi:hypothetical protein